MRRQKLACQEVEIVGKSESGCEMYFMWLKK